MIRILSSSETTCHRKKGFHNADEAYWVRDHVLPGKSVYRCPHCQLWHIGSIYAVDVTPRVKGRRDFLNKGKGVRS